MMSSRLNWTASAAILMQGALLTSLPALDVRVRSTNGVPRVEVNGVAVRARMFYGGPGNRSIRVFTTPREVSFVFTCTKSAKGNGTMHFRFGQKPGTCFLDDVSVTENDSSRVVLGPYDFSAGRAAFSNHWRHWPVGRANTVGHVSADVDADGNRRLRVDLCSPAKGEWPDFHVFHAVNLTLHKGSSYRVNLKVWATEPRDLTIGFYQPDAGFAPLMYMPGLFEEQIALAADVGVNFVSFSVPLPWPRTGETVNWDDVDACCRRVLDANPRALLIPRIGMWPPGWWLDAHPGHGMKWSGYSGADIPAVTSPVYIQEASERLRALVTHLEETMGDHVAGYHPCGQNTGEWFYKDTWRHELHGYSEVTRAAWNEWLGVRYSTDEELRAAWGDPSALRAGCPVPGPARRLTTVSGGLLRDGRDRDVLDFAAFLQDAMADCVLTLARAVRQASQERKLSVFFYGYVFEFAPVRKGAAESGHYALRRVLDSPDIDILCSPISYFDRGLGESAPCMTAGESVTLAGKLWLYEDDTATYLSAGTFPGHLQKVDTLEETNAQLLRNVGQEACRNFGTWWMDLGSAGWFNDPGMWAEMRRIDVLDSYFLKHPTPFTPPVALVIDEQSMRHVSFRGSELTRPLVYESRGALARAGVPFGQYLLDDVLAGRVDASLFVFLNAWALTPQQRERLKTVVSGRSVVWCHAPGYIGRWGGSVDAVFDLTGFSCGEFSGAVSGQTRLTSAGRDAGLRESLGVARSLRPLLYLTGLPADSVWATYAGGEAAVAGRMQAGGVSVVCAAPRLTPGLVRVAAKRAGVHVFTEDECVLYANGPFVVLHGTRSDTVKLHLPTAGPVTDALTGTVLGSGPHLALPLARGQTVIVRY